MLVDIAYPLNTAARIAAGDVPYAQFPLAQAPLHFLGQAALIKLFGPHYPVQIAYAALLNGVAAILTFWIARRLLRGVPHATAVAAALGLALVPLGIYSIYPHPFYDPDACVAILAALAVVLSAREHPTARRWLIAGALLTVPVWIKQNIGGAFLASMIAALVVDAAVRPGSRRDVRWLLGGAAVALAVEVVALQAVIGIDNYLRWAWSFAMSGRGVSGERIASFVDPRVIWLAALIVVPAAISSRVGPAGRAAAFTAALCVPLGVAAVVPSASIAVPQLFPPILIAAATFGLVRAFADGPSFETLVPAAMLVTTLGTLQSQGLPGSTFGIFPLLMIAIASLVAHLARLVPRPVRLAPMVGGVIVLLLFVAGTDYTVSNARLRFIDVNAPGPVVRSAYPSLAGLSARGPYIADLDEILFWTRDHVPLDEGVAFLPGEDPVFFALDRRPALPSVYFYDIATPYTPAELGRFAAQAGLRWVFVKDRLQITSEPPDEQALIAALTARAELVTRVGAYRVYRRDGP